MDVIKNVLFKISKPIKYITINIINEYIRSFGEKKSESGNQIWDECLHTNKKIQIPNGKFNAHFMEFIFLLIIVFVTSLHLFICSISFYKCETSFVDKSWQVNRARICVCVDFRAFLKKKKNILAIGIEAANSFFRFVRFWFWILFNCKQIFMSTSTINSICEWRQKKIYVHCCVLLCCFAAFFVFYNIFLYIRRLWACFSDIFC